MDARTFHHVLQGVMDIHRSRKSTSEVVEELRPLVANSNPQLFNDFLDYIDPANDIERPQATNKSANSDSNSSPRHMNDSETNYFASDKAGQLPPTATNLATINLGRAPSPLHRVVNFSQSPIKAESPVTNRNISSPATSGFPAPPVFYSPVPPTFAQSFDNYVNKDRPLLPYHVETSVSFHGLPLPVVSPDIIKSMLKKPTFPTSRL